MCDFAYFYSDFIFSSLFFFTRHCALALTLSEIRQVPPFPPSTAILNVSASVPLSQKEQGTNAMELCLARDYGSNSSQEESISVYKFATTVRICLSFLTAMRVYMRCMASRRQIQRF
jgi:hypothetical protein